MRTATASETCRMEKAASAAACGTSVALPESGTRHDELAEQMAFSPRPEVRRGRVARFRDPRPDPRGPWVLLPVPPGSPIPPHPFRATLRPPGGSLFFARLPLTRKREDLGVEDLWLRRDRCGQRR